MNADEEAKYLIDATHTQSENSEGWGLHQKEVCDCARAFKVHRHVENWLGAQARMGETEHQRRQQASSRKDLRSSMICRRALLRVQQRGEQESG